MKFHVVAALLGLSNGVHMSTDMRIKQADKMHELCKSVQGIEYPHQSVLLQLDEESQPLPILDKKVEDATSTVR